jgi:hypothetical protein
MLYIVHANHLRSQLTKEVKREPSQLPASTTPRGNSVQNHAFVPRHDQYASRQKHTLLSKPSCA